MTSSRFHLRSRPLLVDGFPQPHFAVHRASSFTARFRKLWMLVPVFFIIIVSSSSSSPVSLAEITQDPVSASTTQATRVLRAPDSQHTPRPLLTASMLIDPLPVASPP